MFPSKGEKSKDKNGIVSEYNDLSRNLSWLGKKERKLRSVSNF
jgi:hypothetical protein